MLRLLPAFLLLSFVFSCQSADPAAPAQDPLTYPETKTVDTVTNYFGTEVADPYRWLEDDRSAETGAWVKEQNKVTFGYLEDIPFRDALKDRLEKLW
ncbi:MAG: S9 family peptidase, partial [Bacteroidota bacterium]